MEHNFKGIQIVCLGHRGDGSLHYNTFLPEILSNEVYRYKDNINSTVYRNVLACNGTIAAKHGIGIIKKQWLDKVRTPAEITLMKSIKQHLDPYNIMNPGELLP
ncbi:putative oxidoreductase [Neisseria meningitidis CU385]|nr:putative oxidoreductase [Neisseria meningitidis CU385]